MNNLAWFLSGAFIFMYATKLWFAMEMYIDDYYLIEHACLNSPDSWFAWHVRAMKRWDTQSYREAVILWVMALMISPKEFKILFNLATVLKIMRNDKESQEYLKKAQANIPAGQEVMAQGLIAEFKKGTMAMLL